MADDVINAQIGAVSGALAAANARADAISAELADAQELLVRVSNLQMAHAGASEMFESRNLTHTGVVTTLQNMARVRTATGAAEPLAGVAYADPAVQVRAGLDRSRTALAAKATALDETIRSLTYQLEQVREEIGSLQAQLGSLHSMLGG
jgi:prefoldin subunit 5